MKFVIFECSIVTFIFADYQLTCSLFFVIGEISFKYGCAVSLSYLAVTVSFAMEPESVVNFSGGCAGVLALPSWEIVFVFTNVSVT